MQANELMAHPFYRTFRQRLDFIVNQMMQQGQMSAQEAQVINQMMQGFGPGTQAFLNSLIARYPSIVESQMDAEIQNTFLPSIRQSAQQQVMMRYNGMQPMQQPGMMGMGYNPMMMQQQPRGFGFGPGFMRNPGLMPGGMIPGVASLGQPSMAAQNAFTPMQQMQPTAGFGGFGTSPNAPTPAATIQQNQQPASALKPDITHKVSEAPAIWSAPKCVGDKQAKLPGGVDVKLAKFDLSDGRNCQRAVVYDPRVRHASDHEAIAAYKNVFRYSKDNDMKILTVIYKQLKVLEVGRDQFKSLVTKVSDEILKNSQSVESKLRAIIAAMGSFSLDSTKEFTNFFLDEFDEHVQAGELCDSIHPKNILCRYTSLQDILDLVTGDIDKNMLNALNAMEGFHERLESVLKHIIDNVILQLPKIILDPFKDRTVLDDYSRVIPQIWSDNGGEGFKGVDDFFDTFLVSRETIDGSRKDCAIKAESELTPKIRSVDNHFTMIYVHRIATWCNCYKSSMVSYDDSTGNCVPHVSRLDAPDCDVAYFLSEIITAMEHSAATFARWNPKSIYFEKDEETFCLQYGKTTDNHLWCCSSRWWK